jgi:NAD(P)-dependent dehydrogenase (short-subunit alcohol dehydrogenase family)
VGGRGGRPGPAEDRQREDPAGEIGGAGPPLRPDRTRGDRHGGNGGLGPATPGARGCPTSPPATGTRSSAPTCEARSRLGLTRALAVELAPHRIQVDCLVPGFFETDLALGNTSPERRETRRRSPAGRWGPPDELVGAAVLLASRASDFITGMSLVVDGGYSVSERLLHD